MNSLSSRQVWRQKKTEEARRDRVTAEYIRLKYPKMYLESLNVYHTLREKYPNKQDIRKLSEFYQICCGPSTNEDPNMVQTETDNNQFQDNMVLNIHLMQNPTTSTHATSQDATTTTLNSTSEDATTTTLNSTSEDATTTLNSTPQDATAMLNSTPQDLQLESLDPSVVDMVMEELRYDSDLNKFFEDIDIDHLSPLEAELLLY